MATDYIWVQGKCKWARVFLENMDKKYGEKFSLILYPTDKSIASLNNAGFRGEFKRDGDGIFVKLSRDNKREFGEEIRLLGPPELTDKDGKPFDQFIGNGSEVAVLLELYDSKKGKGSRMKEVKVLNHVIFEKANEARELPPFEGE